ncbi:hypothetical protein [Mangrovibacterium diazotrophicum]|uniref:NIPSNAP protein n=1 Tax=Mangrovibacterium diazotrophicum TaxID=1261403 RepID=A0A419WBM7_9BACT|nr:hypothetical protein [Mangrovibacterium diazotrophicum]RKD92824.1 hypothetical protein BC643_3201 [Mangrovibacterium diazotrophicum]
MKMKLPKLSLKKSAPFLFALLFSLSSLDSFSQNDNLFAIVDYMKTKPGQEWHYVELEHNFWKQVHQARADNGDIVAWLFYRIRYTATSDPYNYATVTIFNNPEKLENPWSVDPITVHPDKDVEAVNTDTEESRDLVTRNLLYRQDYIPMPPDSTEPKFVQVDYMRVKQGEDGEYLKMEDQVWKPIHEQFIKAGTRAGWSLWGRVYPSGYGLDYQYITVNDFKDFSQLGQADYNAAMKAAHPGEDMGKISQETNETRELVRSELWELIDAVY